MKRKKNIDPENEITVSSLEEQREDMRMYWATLTPIERLSHLIDLIQMSYGLTPAKLKNPGLKNIITIVPPDEHFS